jgi:hypothetical protein
LLRQGGKTAGPDGIPTEVTSTSLGKGRAAQTLEKRKKYPDTGEKITWLRYPKKEDIYKKSQTTEEFYWYVFIILLQMQD